MNKLRLALVLSVFLISLSLSLLSSTGFAQITPISANTPLAISVPPKGTTGGTTQCPNGQITAPSGKIIYDDKGDAKVADSTKKTAAEAVTVDKGEMKNDVAGINYLMCHSAAWPVGAGGTVEGWVKAFDLQGVSAPAAPAGSSGNLCDGACTQINVGTNNGVFSRGKCPGDNFNQCKKTGTDSINTTPECTVQGRTWCGGDKEYCAASGSDCVDRTETAEEESMTESIIELADTPERVVGKSLQLKFIITAQNRPKKFEVTLTKPDGSVVPYTSTSIAPTGSSEYIVTINAGNAAQGDYSFYAKAFGDKEAILAEGSGYFSAGFPTGARGSVVVGEKLLDPKTKRVKITFAASSRISGVPIKKVLVQGNSVQCNNLPAQSTQCSFETEYVTKNLNVFVCLQSDERGECR